MLIMSIILSPEKPGELPGFRIMLDMRISRESRLSRLCHTTPGAQPQPGCRPFEHDLAAEAHEPRRPAAGLRADAAGLLDQALLLDQAAEVLLVQPHAGQRLDRALQLQQRERAGGISSKTTGRYLILPRSRPIAVARMRR